MRCQMEALIAELNRLKQEGVTHVAVSDDALEHLRAVVALRSGGQRALVEDRATKSGRVSLPENHIRTEDAAKTLAEIFTAANANARNAPEPVASPSKGAAGDSAPGKIPLPSPIVLPVGTKQHRWEALRDRVLNCPECNAHVQPGKKVVFGIGNLDADIFFCGEAPGAEEEIKGEPFVGPAGEVLTKIIKAMGLTREDVYIGNIMNWRPEMPTAHGNRPPTPEETAFCLPYLRAQIEVVNPKVVVALGATAAKGLLGAEQFSTLGRARGQVHTFENRPLVVTYHPSYLLRSQPLRTRRMVWEDMLQVMELVGLPISEKQRGFFL
ncbi:MAG: uracil-DNA glycosylase [Opitutaceae bacterium]